MTVSSNHQKSKRNHHAHACEDGTSGVGGRDMNWREYDESDNVVAEISLLDEACIFQSQSGKGAVSSVNVAVRKANKPIEDRYPNQQSVFSACPA
jgi:hypothetical protein